MNNFSNSSQKHQSQPSELAQVEAELCKRSLRRFITSAWHILEPTTRYVHGWHIDAICDHVEALYNLAIQSLIINVPPGHMKSLIVNVLAPTWWWIKHPSTRFLFTSYNQNLSVRDSVKMRRLIESAWFTERFPDIVLTADQNQKLRYDNTKTGVRLLTPIGSAIGERADILTIDDPNSADEIHSKAHRNMVNEAYTQTLSQRGSDPETFRQVLIMQRLHEDDLAGHIIEKDLGWVHLKLPTEYDSEKPCKTVILPNTKHIWADPRTKDSELLWEVRYNRQTIVSKRRILGSQGFASQQQQEPAPTSGAMFKEEFLQFWIPQGSNIAPHTVRYADKDGNIHTRVCPQIELPTRFDDQIQSWDMAFKGETDSAYTVGQYWSRLGSKRFLLDLVREKAEFTRAVAMFREFSAKHPKAKRKIVEDKANGPAIKSTLHREIIGITMWNPDTDKVSRGFAVLPEYEAGDVYFPHPKVFEWVAPLLLEIKNFPNGQYKDQVDPFTQALIWFSRNSVSYPNRDERPSTSSGRRF